MPKASWGQWAFRDHDARMTRRLALRVSSRPLTVRIIPDIGSENVQSVSANIARTAGEGTSWIVGGEAEPISFLTGSSTGLG